MAQQIHLVHLTPGVSQKKPPIPNHLWMAAIASVVLLVFLLAFLYPIESPLPQVSSTRILPAVPAGSNQSLESATTAQSAELIEQLLSPFPYRGNIALPKPSPLADIGTILSYLRKKGANLDGHAWSPQAYQALNNTNFWKPHGGRYPPQYVYPASSYNPYPFLLFYSPHVGDWGISSSLSIPIH
jgi:hypothetical protein